MRISGIGAWSGGTVVDLAVSGDTVLAATFAGIYRSTDRGHTWAPVGVDLPDWFIQAVVLAPVGSQLVGLAASHMGWLYRSMDGGETWETDSFWTNMGIVTRLATSPSFASDGIVFACTEENGIFKSTDRGTGWKQANFGLLNLNATALGFAPTFAQDEVLFAGTDGGGLFRSRNAGRAWRESGEGLPDSAVQCMAISPRYEEDGVLLAGTEDRGIYRSTDGGRTWAPHGEGLSEACVNALHMARDWAAGGRIVAAVDEGLVVSVDGGHIWRPVQGGPDYPYVIAPCGDELLVGAYRQGIYRSHVGETWEASNGVLAAHLPPVVGFSDAFEEDRTLLMTSMEGVLVRSADGGQTWDLLLDEEDSSLSNFVCAGAGDAITVLAAAGSALLRSPDGGSSWTTTVNTGQDTLTALAVSASYAQDRVAVAGSNGGQVWVSRDGGASWHRAEALGGTIVSLAARTGPTGLAVYAVTARATEEGAWQLGLHAQGTEEPLLTRSSSEPVAALCLLEGGGLLCAMGQRVLYLEGGELVAENELEGSASVSCLGVAGDVLLAGTRQGVYRSADHARSWEWLTSDISAVAMRVTSPDRVYVVSMGGRLWQVDLP